MLRFLWSKLLILSYMQFLDIGAECYPDALFFALITIPDVVYCCFRVSMVVESKLINCVLRTYYC